MKLLHTGDVHLGSAFSSLPEPLAAQRRREQRELLRRIRLLAEEEGAELWLIAGDFFDTPHPPEDLAEFAARELGRFSGRVFLVPGNHDCLAPGSPYLRPIWPENVTVFRSRQLTRVELPEWNAALWGAAFQTPEEAGFLTGQQLNAGEETTLLLLHGDLGAPASPYAPLSGAALAASGAHYAALGHVHAPAEGRAGATPWVYCGVPEGRGFDEAEEHAPLSVVLAEVCGVHCALRRLPVALRRVHDRTLPLTPAEDPQTAVLAALPAEAQRDLWRVTLTGEQAAPVDTASLTAALAERVFYAEVRDETRPPVDLWAAAGEPTLRGRFLAALQQRPEDPALRELAARMGLAALTGGDFPEEGGAL